MSTNIDSKTFIWKAFSKWRHWVGEMIPRKIQKKVVETISKSPQAFEYADDTVCFKRFYSKFGNYSELLDKFVAEFPACFRSIRMYHCCRPLDTKSYYRRGIKVLDVKEANQIFRTLFLDNPKFPLITESHIQTAIDHMTDYDSNGSHGFVCFGLDDRFLVKYAHHYLIYGSEYLQGLASFIESDLGYDLKAELKTRGKPTVFEAQIPVPHFCDAEFRELASEAFHTWAYNLAHDQDDPYEIDFSIEVEHGLPSDLIVRHYHPEASGNSI